MTDPSQPTISVVEATPEPVVAEEQPVANAPSFVVIAPHVGSTDVSVFWGEPNEGAADSYLVEVGGASLEVPGTATQVIVQGLAAGQEVTANVTAKYTAANKADAGLETPNDPEVKTYDEDAQPQVDQVPADATPTGA